MNAELIVVSGRLGAIVALNVSSVMFAFVVLKKPNTLPPPFWKNVVPCRIALLNSPSSTRITGSIMPGEGRGVRARRSRDSADQRQPDRFGR